jgi:amidase
MKRDAKIRSAFVFGFAASVLAINLGFGPSSIFAQVSRPSPASKASAPWKFRLEEARIEDIHRAIKSGQITCAKLVQAYINRIRAYDGMCVAPVNPNDASDPQNFFPDVAKYTGTPLQPGAMKATISDPAKLQTYAIFAA